MSTTKYVAIVAVFVLGVFASAPAIGAPFVYEGFDYGTSNKQLSFVDGGTGWDGSWNADKDASYQPTDWFSGDNLPGGGTADRIGGSANKAAGEDAGVWRSTTDLSDKFEAGDTVWFSYLTAVRGDFNGQFDMGFGKDGQGSDSGIGISITGEQMYGRVDGTLTDNSISAPLTTDKGWNDDANLSFFVVGEFVKGSETDSDSLRLWVNEGTELPSAATFEFSDFSLANTPDRFGFNSLASTSADVDNIAVWFDEIQMGTSMDDIGVIPEPSTLALLGLSGLLLMRRRRR